MDFDTTVHSGLSSADNRRLRNDCLVVIPTYNEIENLEPVVRKVLALDMFDVLVIDDHSPDGTGDAADELARRFPGQVTVLHRSGKQGLGSAYVLGFTYALRAGYARVFQMDADFSHDPGCLPALKDSLNAADVVVGSRYAPGGSTQHWPLRRRVLSRAGSAYAALVLGLPLHDLTSGFKGFSRQVLETLNLAAIHSTGYSFQIEITYRCFEQGFHIVEVPILFEDRRLGESKMSGHIVMEALVMVWRLRFGQLRYGRMLRWSSSSGTAR